MKKLCTIVTENSVFLFTESCVLLFTDYTPIAAIGLAMTMVGAIKVHFDRKELDKIKINLVFMVLAVIVAVGRFFIVSGI